MIDDIDEIIETGLLEYFGKKDAVCMIEWAENIKSVLPKNIIELKIEKIDENSRKFTINMGE